MSAPQMGSANCVISEACGSFAEFIGEIRNGGNCRSERVNEFAAAEENWSSAEPDRSGN